MDQLIVGDDVFTITKASRSDVSALVELLRDDFLGKGRELPNLAPYEIAFDDIDHDPNQFLAAIRNQSGELVGTLQLTLIPGLARSGAKRLQIEADRLASSTRGTGLDRSRFGGGWGIFRGFLNLGGTDDGIDTEGIHRGVQSLGGRVRDQ